MDARFPTSAFAYVDAEFSFFTSTDTDVGADPNLRGLSYTKRTKVFQHIQTVPHGRNMHAT